MTIYFGSDHRGHDLKNSLLGYLREAGYQVLDLGNSDKVPEDDYPDFAAAVARKVAGEEKARGILVCGSGAGMDIAANKVRGVRATIGFRPDQVFDARNHDDLNVLVLASDFVSGDEAENMVKIFLETPMSPDPRHLRRVQKITALEEGRLSGLK